MQGWSAGRVLYRLPFALLLAGAGLAKLLAGPAALRGTLMERFGGVLLQGIAAFEILLALLSAVAIHRLPVRTAGVFFTAVMLSVQLVRLIDPHGAPPCGCLGGLWSGVGLEPLVAGLIGLAFVLAMTCGSGGSARAHNPEFQE